MNGMIWDDMQTNTQKLCGGDDTTTTLTDLKRYLNLGIRDVRTRFKGIYILEDEFTDLTEASTQYYPLPIDFHRMKWVTLTIGETVYHPEEVQNYDYWNALNQTTDYTGDVPTAWYIRYLAGRAQVGIFPIPSSAGNTLTYGYIMDQPDLSVDKTNITAVQVTQNDATVFDSGGNFTAIMAHDKRWIRATAATGGDAHWYRVQTFTDTQHIELGRAYEGPTDSSVTVDVAQMALLPPNTHILPCYYAAAHYYWGKRNTQGMGDKMWALYLDGIKEGKRLWGLKSVSQVGRHGRGLPKRVDVNFPPRNLSSLTS